MRLTLNDVAREAGVSSATVDRVLNNRAGVRRETRDVVLETATRLGYLSNDSADAIERRGRVRLDFVLPAGTNTFIHDLKDRLREQASQNPRLEVELHLIEVFNPHTLAAALEDLRGRTQGVGLIAIDHPAVRESVRSLIADDIKVVTLVSDIAQVPRVAYIGIDNRAAGRLAGYLLGRFLGPDGRKKIALFAGSLSYRGHEEREAGFRNILAEDYPNLDVVDLRESRDDRERAYTEALALLGRHPDLAGIYNIGAGNPGIARALTERGRGGNVVLIGHELTSHHRRLLLDGTVDAVIDQNPRVEAREAIAALTNAVWARPHVPHPPRLQVILRENIPND